MRHGPHSSRRQRGGAIVEMTIMMLVIIPVLVYGVFLMDAAYLKLDLQETVVSGVWDFTTRNTEPKSGSHSGNSNSEVDQAERAVRVVYSDHTSAFDDGADPKYPGYGQTERLRSNVDHQKHHIGFGAHYSFRFSNGEDTQFRCERNDKDMDWLYEPNMKAYGTSRFAVGGQVTCTAKGYIYNYIIPETFMQEFAGETKVTRITRRRNASGTQAVHDAEPDRGENASIETSATAAVSFNTWALLNGSNNGTLTNSSADIGARNMLGLNSGPNLDNNPFYERVRHINTANGLFAATYANVALNGMNMMQTAASEKLMAVAAVPAPAPNPPVLPNVIGTYLTARYQPDTPGVRQTPPGLGSMMHKGFLSTPYDGVNNNYRTARNKRGVYYLGCRGAEGKNCN